MPNGPVSGFLEHRRTCSMSVRSQTSCPRYGGSRQRLIDVQAGSCSDHRMPRRGHRSRLLKATRPSRRQGYTSYARVRCPDARRLGSIPCLLTYLHWTVSLSTGPSSPLCSICNGYHTILRCTIDGHPKPDDYSGHVSLPALDLGFNLRAIVVPQRAGQWASKHISALCRTSTVASDLCERWSTLRCIMPEGSMFHPPASRLYFLSRPGTGPATRCATTNVANCLCQVVL